MMTLRYVFSEAGLGLRRNLSMAVALIVTIFVSLTLVGLGVLINAQAQKARESLGSQLTISAQLCNKVSISPNCNGQDTTTAQKDAIIGVLKSNPQVAKYEWQSKQQAYDLFRKIYTKGVKDGSAYATVTVADMHEVYKITLKDPRKYADVESQLAGMPGVDQVRDLHEQLGTLYRIFNFLKWGAIGIAVFLLIAAILQVANTIRLATLARSREIGIMRLVGASSLYISLPFLMEILVAAMVGVVLGGLALACFTYFFVYGVLRQSHIMEWVNWNDLLFTFGFMAVVGVVLTMIPTLIVTRRYLKI